VVALVPRKIPSTPLKQAERGFINGLIERGCLLYPKIYMVEINLPCHNIFVLKYPKKLEFFRLKLNIIYGYLYNKFI
jgi:hypothetical protein